MQTLLKSVTLALVLLALTSCNTVKLGYNNAQELTYWWLHRYVHFSEAQKPVIKAELATLHEWHRLNEIPAYIQILESLQQSVMHDMNSSQVCLVAENVRDRFKILNLQIEPIAEKISPSLTHEQLAHIEKHFAKNNEKWRKDWLDDSEQKREEHRLKLSIKRAEMLYGKLNDGQRKVLQQNIRQSSFNADTSYAERLGRQADFIAMLERIIDNKLTAPDIKLQVSAYFNRLVNGSGPAYQQYMKRMTLDACAGIAKLHNATDMKQRQRAAEKLASYIKDLNALKASAQIHE